jgi:hypothetical protein
MPCLEKLCLRARDGLRQGDDGDDALAAMRAGFFHPKPIFYAALADWSDTTRTFKLDLRDPQTPPPHAERAAKHLLRATRCRAHQSAHERRGGGLGARDSTRAVWHAGRFRRERRIVQWSCVNEHPCLV